jgi:asparagine N-glycosylation enzyme membrane subunit Stt3
MALAARQAVSARRRYLFVLALAVVAVLLRWTPAQGLRASAEERRNGAPELLLTDAETCLHLRAVEVAIAQNELARVDRALFHPHGDLARNPPGLDGALAVALQLLGWRPGSEADNAASALEKIALWFGPLCGGLLVLACYLLARLAFSRSPCVEVAALAAATVAAAFAIDSFSGLVRGATLSGLLCTFSAATLVWGMQSNAAFDRVLSAVIAGALGALGLLCSLSAWFPLALVQVAGLVAAARANGERARDLHRAQLLHLIAFALVLLVPARASVWNLASPGTLSAWSNGWLALVLGLAAGHGLCLFLFRRGVEEHGIVRALLPIVGLIAMPLCMAETRGAWASLRDAQIGVPTSTWTPVVAMASALYSAVASRRSTYFALCITTGLLLVAGWSRFPTSDARARAAVVELLSGLRSLRDSGVTRGAWPAAGSGHLAGVYAPEIAALVPYHSRRSVLPGVYPASALDNETLAHWRTVIARAGVLEPADLRDSRLAALGASHAIERTIEGHWRVRTLSVLAGAQQPILRAVPAQRDSTAGDG